MLKLYRYIFAVLLFFSSCESLYEPDLELTDDVMVVDARLIYGQQKNDIVLQYSTSFNENAGYKPITTATVLLTDDTGTEYPVVQNEPGIYSFYGQLDSLRKYQLKIFDKGETYASVFEAVPPLPAIDTLYSDHADQWIKPGGENNTDNFLKHSGQQLFVNIDTGNSEQYFRFSARKILQYFFAFDTVVSGVTYKGKKYCWKSYYSEGAYNVAGPAEYTTHKDIMKHPVEFFSYNDQSLIDSTENALGWIYIMHQYSISKSAYVFYKDLSSQIDGQGKIFDPMYIQARSNLKCDSDPSKLVLGNFEVARYKEHRYYVRLNNYSGEHIIRPIDVFHDIPQRGFQPITMPVFWER